MSLLSFLKETVFAQEYASLEQGFLQSLDARIKLIAIVLWLISVLLLKSIVILCFVYLLCILWAYLSQIRLSFFFLRTWIFIPVFSLFIALPVLFDVFSPGEAILSFQVIGLDLIITRQGLFSAALFVLRVLICVSLAVLLTLTTRHTELLRVLRIFRIPQVFVITLGMCYRYIYLFLEIIENTCLAVKSRSGLRLPYKKGQRIAIFSIASLWQRSFWLNQKVYNAMLSRGYSGEPQILDEFKIRFKDWLWLSFSLIILSLAVYLFCYAKQTELSGVASQ